MLPLLATLIQDPPEGPPPAGPSMWPLLIGIGAIFYFVMIRPASKERKQREEMLGSLSKGAKVITTSGILGTVTQVQENVVTLQVADGVRLRFVRSAIQSLVDDEKAKDKEKEPAADK